ncbi:pentapeptide repeat-containing protein [Paenibacillus sp. R14(2021)]|uniref:pentapeptide repeat-containing protein n=1 Tax=Paenibacillus sp. R14(2021) TaxID=2859228 RepID=UPI001C615802|nr:pentapeptide repeat-containing protein [Paenibacillus sp. R14(2021)]
MYIERDITIEELIIELNNGIRSFRSIDVVNSGDLSNWDLQGVTFDECFLTGVDFTKCNLKNARLIATNLKTCIFQDADLTDAEIRYCAVESVDWHGAVINGTVFEENSSYGQMLSRVDLEQMVI